MKTYPIALELTVWFDLGLNQYEVSIDEASKISIKRTDDVLHSRELLATEVQMLIDAINAINVPVTSEVNSDLHQASPHPAMSSLLNQRISPWSSIGRVWMLRLASPTHLIL